MPIYKICENREKIQNLQESSQKSHSKKAEPYIPHLGSSQNQNEVRKKIDKGVAYLIIMPTREGGKYDCCP